MDVIYTDANRKEVGVLHSFTLDYENNIKPERNTFEIEQIATNDALTVGGYWFCVGEEYGGKIDSIKIDTANNVVTYGGRTWRGILASKVLIPPSGADYYTVSGDLNIILSDIITKVGLGDLFKASTQTTKTVTFKFDRYTDAFSGINKLLSKNGYKLMCRWDNKKVLLYAEPVVDYGSQMEIASDMFDFILKKDKSAINHMIGLGAGELRNRLVVHKYIDANGNVSNTQHYFGLDEVVGIFESNNTSDATELGDNTAEKLLDASIQDTLDVKANDIEADLGDSFVATSLDIGISVKQYVVQKVTNFTESTRDTQYWVGSSMY